MKSIREYIENGGTAVSEASETHVFLDDVKQELDKITAHVNDDGYIDKMYAEEYARKALEITLMHIGLELMNKKPFDFGKPKKIAKAAAAKHCKLCK